MSVLLIFFDFSYSKMKMKLKTTRTMISVHCNRGNVIFLWHGMILIGHLHGQIIFDNIVIVRWIFYTGPVPKREVTSELVPISKSNQRSLIDSQSQPAGTRTHIRLYSPALIGPANTRLVLKRGFINFTCL